MQRRYNSSVLAMELCLFCIKPLLMYALMSHYLSSYQKQIIGYSAIIESLVPYESSLKNLSKLILVYHLAWEQQVILMGQCKKDVYPVC